jgi:hypothetical protein
VSPAAVLHLRVQRADARSAREERAMVRRGVLLALVAVLAAGCMTFDGRELPRVDMPEAMPEPPMLWLQVGEVHLRRNGRVGAALQASAAIGEAELTRLARHWQDAGLIRGSAPACRADASARFQLSLSGLQSEEEPGLGALLTGLSLFLIPARATVRYEWQFALTDLRSGSVYEVPVSRSMTTWVHLAFLPALPFWAAGEQRARADQALYVYDELSRQGAWDSFVRRSPAGSFTAGE